jgi:hypothetical protein
MIARQWHGRVRAADADAYHQYLLRTGVRDYRSVPGNRGVQVLRRQDGDVVHYLGCTPAKTSPGRGTILRIPGTCWSWSRP